MNQNSYIAGSRLAVENSRFLSTDSTLPQDLAFTGIFQWRRGRDSNPRWAFDPYALSRGAPSTTRPPLRQGASTASAERGMIPVVASQGKAEYRLADVSGRSIGDLDRRSG